MCHWYRNVYACGHYGDLTRDPNGCNHYDRTAAKCGKGELNPSFPHVNSECHDCQVADKPHRPSSSYQVGYCYLEGNTSQLTPPSDNSPPSQSKFQFSGPAKQSSHELDEDFVDLTEFGFMYSSGEKRQPRKDLNKSASSKRLRIDAENYYSEAPQNCRISDAADILQIPMINPTFFVEQKSLSDRFREGRGEAGQIPSRLHTENDEMDWTPTANESPISPMTPNFSPIAPTQPSLPKEEDRKRLEEERLTQEYYAGEIELPPFRPVQPIKLHCGFATYQQLLDSVVSQIQQGEHTATTVRQEAGFLSLTQADQQKLLLEFEHILQRPYTVLIGPQRPITERPKMHLGLGQRMKAKARQLGQLKNH